VAPVIEKVQLRGTVPMELQRTNYHAPFSGIYLPLSEEVQVASNPIETRYQYHAYDNRGRIASVSKVNDKNTCYIWGYGNEYVIAKIESADYATVVNALGGATAVENFKNLLNPSETDVLNFLAPLRTHPSLAGAMVTTYTYLPLVGVIRTCDVNNQFTFYEYDSFGRLKLIRDHDNRILKTFDYKYQEQH
jgi:YD repeat-containing protein